MKVPKSLSFIALLLTVLAVGGWYGASLQNRKTTDQSAVALAPASMESICSGDTDSAQPAPTAAQGNITETGKFEPFSQPPPPGISSAETMLKVTAQHLQETAPGEITIGRVKLRKKDRSISFPATIAERERPLEYALVHENGKIHEALFMTSIPVRDLHVAALLLEAMGQAPTITVTWPKHGGDVFVDLSELIEVGTDDDNNLDTDLLARGDWSYNGSKFQHGGFAAMNEGSLIALMNDPSALINHPAAGALLRDDIFLPRPNLLPPVGIEVTIHLTFPDHP